MSPSTTVVKPSEGQMEAKTEMDRSQTQDSIPKDEIVSKVKNFKMRYGIYSGDMKNGKRHGQGVFVFSHAHSITKDKMYSGSWIDDVQDGQGTLTDIDGNTFFGTFKNNVLEGFATKKIRNFFDGNGFFHWLINRFDGEFDQYRNPRKGAATFVNGWTFHCDYNENGQPHGKGCVKDCSGKVVFESEWKKGICDNLLFDISSVLSCVVVFAGLFFIALMIIACFLNFGYQLFDEKYGSCFKRTGPMWQFKHHGYGSRVINHQGVYNGSWENGLRHGHGVMKWEDPKSANHGDVFVGEWRDGQRHGFGVATLNRRGVYNGSWENDMRHGQGSMVYNDSKAINRGGLFVGQWVNDTWSHGIYSFRSESLYTGGFVDNKYHLECGVLSFTDGMSYTGDFVDGIMHGYGVLNYTDGSSYAGTFNQNKREGHGVFLYENGDGYVGNWKGDMREGHGVLLKTSDIEIAKWEGEWLCDKKHGWFSHTRWLFHENSPLFLISIEGVMRDNVTVSGTKVMTLIPNILSAALVYKDAKVVSASVTLFSIIAVQVFDELLAVVISAILFALSIFGSILLIGLFITRLFKK